MLKIFLIEDKNVLIYLMIIQELDLKPFTKAKQDETKGTGLEILSPK